MSLGKLSIGDVLYSLRAYLKFDIRAIIFISLSLFDFYRDGFRITEFLAYGLMLYLAFSAIPKAENIASLLGLLVVVCGYFVFGINHGTNYETLKSALGIFVATLAFILFSLYGVRVPEPIVRTVIWINIAFFMVQLVTYYAAGYLIDYHWFTDMEARLEGGGIFRPAGLYYEPAIYSLAMFMLATLLDPRRSRLNVTSLAAAATMAMSFSLWGMGSAAVLLFRVGQYNRRAGAIGALVAIVAIGFLTSVQDLEVLDLVDAVDRRLGSLQTDGSAVERYGGLTTVFDESDSALIFGFGFGGPLELYGANAFGRLLSEVGLVGVAAFLSLLFWHSHRRWDLALCLVPVLLAAPIVTYGFWAFWLSCMSLQSRDITACAPARPARKPWVALEAD